MSRGRKGLGVNPRRRLTDFVVAVRHCHGFEPGPYKASNRFTA